MSIRHSLSVGVRLWLALAGGAMLPAAGEAAGWGSLQGRFVVEGDVPELPTLDVSKEAYCTEHQPINETIIVSDDGHLANVVVYLRLGRRDTIDVHPDYAATQDEPVVLDNKGCTFVPHITLLRTSQRLILKNSDPVGHNTNLNLQANGRTNNLIAAGTQLERSLSRPETTPRPVDCNIHPFMHAYILVLNHPYMAASAQDGTFEIKQIPAGKHEFQFWHEAPGYLQNVKYRGGALDRRGRADLTIADGQTLDLGDVTVPASLLR